MPVGSPGFAAVLVAFGAVAAVVLLLSRWTVTRDLAVGVLAMAILVVLLHNSATIEEWAGTIRQLPGLQGKAAS